MKDNNLPEEWMEVFQNPGKEYRGTPFWSWNTKLDQEVLDWQITQFKEMGMGGFYIHTRVGLDTEYLGEAYLDCVKKSVAIAKEKGLYACLYDEDRWPSGYGGGKVTMHREYRSKNLLITPFKKGTKVYDNRNFDSMASPSPQGNGSFVAAYDVKLNEDGTLFGYERCEEGAVSRKGYQRWHVYLETAHDSPWFNNQSYVDSLNPEAVRCFLNETHEIYNQAVGPEFAKTIPSIFTDEPQFGKKRCLGTAFTEEEVMLPYTEGFAEGYQQTYGTDLLDHIPELLWELPGGAVSEHRYQYHAYVAERFAQSYCGQVGAWCRKHGISLAGHMMEEPTLQSQTQALGEVMRNLREFDLPGIDMLCDAHEYTTAKQAQSICHQYGKKGVVSELYGVTNWDFDFRGHKLQGDWQAALGVTHRVHHLNWMSMGGEAKRDYPAAIGFQSPWYREYSRLETHFARVNTALRRGKPVVKIGVIHPVESYWILYGPNEQTGLRRQELDDRFQALTEWLLFHNLDFDFLSESLLPGAWDGRRVGEMEYDVILVPGCLTLRNTTLSVLKEFHKRGKTILFMGKIPRFVDARVDNAVSVFAKNCKQIEFARADLLEALEEYRLVDIRYYGEKHLKKPNHKKNWNGACPEKYLYQMRQEGTARWLFIAQGRRDKNPNLILPDDVKIELAGTWKITEWDTAGGTVQKKDADVRNGKTICYHRFYAHDSLLLRLEPSEETCKEEKPCEYTEQTTAEPKWESMDLFCAQAEILREEPNVMILDMPEYQCGQGQWEGPDEILRIDNKLREKLGMPLRMAALAQPWTREANPAGCQLKLKYRFICEEELSNIRFAMEHLECACIMLDGTELEKEAERYYVDPCIRAVRLPLLTKGAHELVLEIAFTENVNLESCYLTGEFDVDVHGSNVVLRKVRQAYNWAGLTGQGMPFYGGNAIYRARVELDPGIYSLQVSKYRAPLLKIIIDGVEAGTIIGAPYQVEFELKTAGSHVIDIKSFGSRINTFGALHNCDEHEIYFDPNAWRTTGDSWSYEYQLKPAGILKAPVLWKRQDIQREE